MLSQIFESSVSYNRKKFLEIGERLKRNDPSLKEISIHDVFFCFEQSEREEINRILSLIPTSSSPVEVLKIINVKIDKQWSVLIAEILRKSKNLKVLQLTKGELLYEDMEIICSSLTECKQLLEFTLDFEPTPPSDRRTKLSNVRAICNHPNINSLSLLGMLNRLELLTLAYELMRHRKIIKISLTPMSFYHGDEKYANRFVVSNIQKFLDTRGEYSEFDEGKDERMRDSVKSLCNRKTQLFLKLYLVFKKTFSFLERELERSVDLSEENNLEKLEANFFRLYENLEFRKRKNLVFREFSDRLEGWFKSKFEELKKNMRAQLDDIKKEESSLGEQLRKYEYEIKLDEEYLLKVRRLKSELSKENAKKILLEISSEQFDGDRYIIRFPLKSYIKEEEEESVQYKEKVILAFETIQRLIEERIEKKQTDRDRTLADSHRTIDRVREYYKQDREKLIQVLDSWLLHCKVIIFYAEILDIKNEIDEMFQGVSVLMDQYYFSYVIAFEYGLENQGVPDSFEIEEFYPSLKIYKSFRALTDFANNALGMVNRDSTFPEEYKDILYELSLFFDALISNSDSKVKVEMSPVLDFLLGLGDDDLEVPLPLPSETGAITSDDDKLNLGEMTEKKQQERFEEINRFFEIRQSRDVIDSANDILDGRVLQLEYAPTYQSVSESKKRRDWDPVLFSYRNHGVKSRIIQDSKGRHHFQDYDSGRYKVSPLKSRNFVEGGVEQFSVGTSSLSLNVGQETLLYDVIRSRTVGNKSYNGSIGFTPYASAQVHAKVKHTSHSVTAQVVGSAKVGGNVATTYISTGDVRGQLDVDLLSGQVSAGANFSRTQDGKIDASIGAEVEFEGVKASISTEFVVPFLEMECNLEADIGVGLSAALLAGYSNYKTKFGGSLYIQPQLKVGLIGGYDVNCTPIIEFNKK